MKFSTQLFFYFILYSSICLSQNMKEGFTYLETGKYKQAETFFENILITYPKNKTAKLCYGRALGLNGNGERATAIFINLLERYPQDFEIKLNYAESLLWNENYHKAKSYYKNLLEENPNSFPALLGYANTLSNLKFFNEALEFIDKALLTSPGNLNALTSKKYINLGYANQYVQNGDYKAALKLLLKNLQLFKKDIETLQNIANVYLISSDFSKAEATYKTIGTSPQNKLTSLNSLALVSHLKGKNKKALEISSEAINYISNKTSESLLQQTKERYAQALIWNRKYKKADILIQKLNNEYPNKNWVLSLRASLNTYKSNFEKSINDYNRILKNDTTSFDGNLGKANALKASGYFIESYKSAENTLKFYKNQKDAVNFIKKLDKIFTPFLETKFSHSFDNGNNEADAYDVRTEIPFSTKFKLLANYNYRTTSNSVAGLNATTNNLLLGASYQLKNNLTLKGSFGVTSSDSDESKYSQLLTDISLNIKPFKLQNLELGYKRDIQNFNAALLDKQIVQNNLILNYSLNTNFNLGWFTQYYYTWQSDENARNLLFTSLYYNILAKPSLKGGINYQNLSFKLQVPSTYFSPSKFNAVEVFVDLIKDEAAAKNKEWFYGLTAATGLQYIEDDDGLSTYRVQANLGYKFSERALINLYGLQSNIASAVANAGSNGFTYTEFGLRFKWYFLSKPLYKKYKS